MLWPASMASYLAAATPVDQATGSIAGYILGFGPLGIVALALAWLLFRGWRLVPPGYEAQVRAGARDDARADLIEERDRVLAEKHEVQDQRDDAVRFATDQLVPLLTSFTSSTGALIPLLQELVRYQGGGSGSDLPRRRR